jgi:ABC-type glycerol-3-phosphate transport system substrate-binding protein
LLLLALTDLPDADAAGMISPFPAAAASAVDAKDIFSGLKEAALSREKKLIAAPVSAPALLCYYRKDLLEAAGRAAPETWDDYQQLIDEIDEWAPGLAAIEPAGPKFRASLFLARSAAFAKHPQSYSLWFDIQTGEPLFDTPGFHRALETAAAAWNKMPAEIWNLSPAECRQAIVAGKSALALTWEPSGSYPRPEWSSDTGDGVEGSAPTQASTGEPLAIGVIPLPGSTALYNRDASRWETVAEPNRPGFVGFTGLVMGVHAESPQAAAWHLAGMLTKHQNAAFADRPQSPCREADANAAFSFDPAIAPETASRVVDATAQTLRRHDVVCDLAIPNADDVRAIIGDELLRWRSEDRTPDEALTAIQQRVVEATKDRRAELRDNYRRSLGLSPAK